MALPLALSIAIVLIMLGQPNELVMVSAYRSILMQLASVRIEF